MRKYPMLHSTNTKYSKISSFSSQFAYHEATYFIIRLLQEFTGFALDKSENLQIPTEWATCEGLQGTEKVFPATHLTLHVKVSFIFVINRDQDLCDELLIFSGWPLGKDGAVEVVGE